LTRAKNFYNLIIVFVVPKKIKEVSLMILIKESDVPKTLGIGIIYRCPFCGNDLHQSCVDGSYKCPSCGKHLKIDINE